MDNWLFYRNMGNLFYKITSRMNQGLFTSNTPEWETPQELFDELDMEFHFGLDVCASKENHKCSTWFGKKEDGLSQDWSGVRCWMNPPYGREIGKWVKKASEIQGGVVVCLLPARTDTKWFHDYIYGKAEIRFLKGRVKFSGKGPAPFPSMIVIFNP